MKRLWLFLLLLPLPVHAMEVRDVQGGCDVQKVRKLVKRFSPQLERCKPEKPAMVHVTAQGKLERVDLETRARVCMQARMATWKVPMKAAQPCLLELVTNADMAIGKLRLKNIQAFEADQARKMKAQTTPVPPEPKPTKDVKKPVKTHTKRHH